MIVQGILQQNHHPVLPVPGAGDQRVAHLGAAAIPNQHPPFIVRLWRATLESAKTVGSKISLVFFSILNCVKPVLGARALALWMYVRHVWERAQGQIREENLQDRVAELELEKQQLLGRVEILDREKNHFAASLQQAQERNGQLEQIAQEAVAARDEALAAKAQLEPQIPLLQQQLQNSAEHHQIIMGLRDQALGEKQQALFELNRAQENVQQGNQAYQQLQAAKEAIQAQLEPLQNQVREAVAQLHRYQAEEQLRERYEEINQNIKRLIELSQELKNNPDQPLGPYELEVDIFVANVQTQKQRFLDQLEQAKRELLQIKGQDNEPHALSRTSHAALVAIERIAVNEEKFLQSVIDTLQARAARQQPLANLFRQIQIIYPQPVAV